MNEQIALAKQYVGGGRLKDAIATLEPLSQTNGRHNEVLLMKAKVESFERERSMGIISSSEASVTFAQLSMGILSLCDRMTSNPTNPPPSDENLHQYPTGPMVEGYLIDDSIIDAYARTAPHGKALVVIRKANKMRKQADPGDPETTIIEESDLLNVTAAKPKEFWADAFHEACLNGPRMLAALLLAHPDRNFRPEAKAARAQLLELLKTYTG